MSSRTIQHPGIELNEIDRSQYGKVDNSLPGAPTTLVVGFASKGEDYALQWIDSKTTLDDTYGIPTTEFERYFYNAAIEVLNRGGTCIAAKLPYYNQSKDKYNYIDYTVELCSTCMVTSDGGLSGDFNTLGEFNHTLSNVIDYLRLHGFKDQTNIDSVRGMVDALDKISSFAGESRIDAYDGSITTVGDMFTWLSTFIATYSRYTSMFALYASDPTLTSYLDIKLSCGHSGNDYGVMDELEQELERLDNYITRAQAVDLNTFRIYDMTRSQYSKFNSPRTYVSCIVSSENNELNEFLGIVPVVTTPANAMFFQNLLDFSRGISADENAMASFSQVSSLTALYNSKMDSSGMAVLSNMEMDTVIPLPSHAQDIASLSSYTLEEQMLQWTSQESLSRRASMQFPLIDYDGMSHFSRDHLKDIGIVVFKAYKDADNNGKVNFALLESFVGSFDKYARDPVTKADRFIDNVVNASSQYIMLFSNIDQKLFSDATTIAMSNQHAVSMGFYKVDCKKIINYVESIAVPLTRVLDAAANRDTLPLDIVADAGMSNIANIARSALSSEIDTDIKPNVAEFTVSDNKGWRAIIKKFDDFVKYTRKDCMFIADGLRGFCLDGNVKIVRKTCPCNSVMKSIMPRLGNMTGLFDSSYSAGYCNWFYQKDSSSGDYFWIPPSIKAAGVYIYCDTYFQPWNAPAGLTRGVLNDVVDVAFVPNEEEAGKIYSARWNYAMSYPLDGIVIEGHKTFQSRQTALDRVNVRRLMLYLEKQTVRIARWFVYEGNTPYMRQRFVDTLRPIFEDAVRRDGVKEYAIKCDDEINTTQVIENNELRCRIAVIPVKCVDYIVLDFIVSRQNANVSEEVRR